jgi:hypothetical protein
VKTLEFFCFLVFLAIGNLAILATWRFFYFIFSENEKQTHTICDFFRDFFSPFSEIKMIKLATSRPIGTS